MEPLKRVSLQELETAGLKDKSRPEPEEGVPQDITDLIGWGGLQGRAHQHAAPSHADDQFPLVPYHFLDQELVPIAGTSVLQEVKCFFDVSIISKGL